MGDYYALRRPFNGKTLSGNYLASNFARQNYDWASAQEFMDNVLEHDPGNAELQRRTMILAMGSGNYDHAMALLDRVSTSQDIALSHLFLIIKALKEKNYEQALVHVNNMPEGNLSEFIMPLMKSWTKAATGKLDVKNLSANTIHIYHRILIMHMLDEIEGVEQLLQQSMNAHGLTLGDVERIADVYVYLEQKDKAKELYEAALSDMPSNAYIIDKLAALDEGKNIEFFEAVDAAELGVALALSDMAILLSQERSDESAKVFANMALYLDPSLSRTKMLLANISARNNRPNEAIAYYKSISADDKYFLEASRNAADLLEDMDEDQKALNVLKSLFDTYQDIDALIQIGDIHRRNEDFSKAIKSYNVAEKVLGDIRPEFWHLHYLRGIAYEQNKQWDKAEKDLVTALEFQPDHPLVLNYLGYSWADQGLHLEKSLDYIRKAAAKQSNDGYIIDSLGWVLYRMNRFEEAVPHLERAVELVPYDPIINDHLGDAYWQVGRKREAQFQWLRAKNHTEDEELKSSVQAKLESGLEKLEHLDMEIIKEAHSTQDQESIKQ